MAARCEIEPDFAAPLAQAKLVRARDFLALRGGEVVARSRTTSTTRHSAGGRRFYLKRYLFPTGRDRRRGAFRGTFLGASKARREWRNLGFLEDAGIAVPRRAAWGEVRRMGFVTGCFLLTEELDGARPLDQELARGRCADLLPRAGALAAALHSLYYIDGTLALRNLLVRPERKPESLYKVDCPKGRVVRGISPSARGRDLAPLVAGTAILCGEEGTEALLGGYAEAAGLGDLSGIEAAAQALSARLAAREKVRLRDAGWRGGD
jgi:tRNA A-37 threonylcarbamoyl transferase component Bud32